MPNISPQQNNAYLQTALRIHKYPPAKEWLLVCLINLCPSHTVFDKGYVGPREPRE